MRQRRSGSFGWLLAGTEDDRARAPHVGDRAGRDGAERLGGEHRVGGADAHRQARRHAQELGDAGRQRPCFGGWHDRRQAGEAGPAAGGPRTRQRRRVRPPGAGVQVVAAVPGGGAGVGEHLTGEPAEEVVLGAGHERRARQPLRLVPPDPGHHRQEVPAVERLAGAAVQLGCVELGEHLGGLVLPAAILPGEGGADGLACGIEGDERGDHARQPDARPRLGRHGGGELLQGRLRRRRPVGRLLLGAARAGPRRVVPLAGLGERPPVIVQGDGLEGRRAQVEAYPGARRRALACLAGGRRHLSSLALRWAVRSSNAASTLSPKLVLGSV